MFSNYLKIAYRNLLRNKLYSVITILGLAIGLCGFILISLYVRHEYSFDKFHYNYENLY